MQQDLSIIKQITNLQNKNTKELTEFWSKLFEHPPAVFSREHMVSRLAYRIQELAYGGTDEGTERKIQAAARDINKPKKVHSRKYCPMVGTKIIKEYKGIVHEIIVVPDGFSYGGVVYNSLSAIATKISGTKWNGLKFFNIGAKDAK